MQQQAFDLFGNATDSQSIEDILNNTPQVENSKYFGVFLNKREGFRTHPYRVAVQINRGRHNEQWVGDQYGVFKCEHVAATVANIVATLQFNGKAMLNPVDKSKMDQDEYDAWAKSNYSLIDAAKSKAAQAQASGHVPRLWEIR